MHKSNPDDLLSRDQIERETGGGITRRWLEMAAFRGDGPPFIKLSSRCVRYRRSDFEIWLSVRTVASQSTMEQESGRALLRSKSHD